MLDCIKSIITHSCGKLSKGEISPTSSPTARRRIPQNPVQVPLKTETGITTGPPKPSAPPAPATPPAPPAPPAQPATPPRLRIPDPIPITPSQDQDESFRIPGPATWEIPRDSPVVVERTEDMGKYMRRCPDCLERKGDVILGCGHGICQECFERGGRSERCISCQVLSGA